MFLDTDVLVRQVDADTWEVREPIRYQGRVDTFTVPVGFRTDFASVPRAVTWLLPRYGLYTRSAILHDYLWRTGATSRADADGIFRRSMRETGVTVPRRWLMWAAVRLASRMRGATAIDWLVFVVVALLGAAFVAVPVVVVQVFLWLFWLVEAGFWGGGAVVRRPTHPPDTPVSAA